MRQEAFNLENLRLLDFGKIGEAFNHELEFVVKDCMDRPLDDGARTVVIQFTLKPVPDSHGTTVECDTVDVACDVIGKIPKRKTKVYSMKPRHDGKLAFHPDLPEEPDGSTLYDEETGEVKDRKRSA